MSESSNPTSMTPPTEAVADRPAATTTDVSPAAAPGAEASSNVEVLESGIATVSAADVPPVPLNPDDTEIVHAALVAMHNGDGTQHTEVWPVTRLQARSIDAHLEGIRAEILTRPTKPAVDAMVVVPVLYVKQW